VGVWLRAAGVARPAVPAHLDPLLLVPLPDAGDVAGERRARPGHGRGVGRQQLAQGGRAHLGHRRQCSGIGLFGQAPRSLAGGHRFTTVRAVRRNRASAACSSPTCSTPTRSATVRATRATLCSPRAVRAPSRSLAASNPAAFGWRGGSPAPVPSRAAARARAAPTRAAETAVLSP